MNKPLFFLIFFISLFLIGYASADTIIPGGIISTNTTWSLAGSPFIVTSTVQINGVLANQTITLTIEPGVTVKFNPGTGLVVGKFVSGTGPGYGVLIAQGTFSNPIIFTSNSGTPTPGDWNGIHFDTTTSASILDFCTIEYGGGDINNANLRIAFSTPTIQNSTIRQSDGYGVYVSGSGVRPALTGNAFANNGTYPLHIEIRDFPTTFSNNTYTNNTIQAIELVGGTLTTNITLVNETLPYIVTSTIQINGVLANQTFTLTLQPGVTLKFGPGAGLIVGKDVFGTGPGWGILDARGTLSSPILFTSNSATPSAGDWNGIHFDTTTSASTLDYCIVEYGGGASTGIKANLLLQPPGPVVSFTSVIRNSTIRNSTGYGVYVAGTGISAVLQRNNFSGNSLGGVWNDTPSGTLNGRASWWGHLSGPSGAGSGTGDAVNTRVFFDAWLEGTVSQPFHLLDAYVVSPTFNPNGGATAFIATFPEEANWNLEIQDASQMVVKSFSGTGPFLNKHWDGKDNGNLPLADGTYAYRILATSAITSQNATPARGQVRLDRTALTVQITSPQGEEIVSGEINVTGTASGPNFSSYFLEYGSGVEPASWTPINSTTTPVTNGLLGIWKTFNLTNGLYTLRLRTVNTLNQETVDQILVTLDNIQVTNVSVAPVNIDPYAGETASIAYTLDRSADVTLKIYNEQKTLVRSLLINAPRLAGANSDAWDGRNDASVIAPLGKAYYFVIDAQNAIGRKGRYNDATTPLMAPQPTVVNPRFGLTEFDPYKNQPMPITYDTNIPGRIKVQITQPPGFVDVRLLVNFELRLAGSHEELWDGRKDDGTFWEGNSDGYVLGQTIPLNAILLLSPSGQIQNFLSEAYLILPLYREVSEFKYTLTRDVDVTVEMKDPNGNHFRTLVNTVRQIAGPQSVEWDGRDDSGKVATLEGSYRVTITAVDAVNGQVSTRTGSVMVYR